MNTLALHYKYIPQHSSITTHYTGWVSFVKSLSLYFIVFKFAVRKRCLALDWWARTENWKKSNRRHFFFRAIQYLSYKRILAPVVKTASRSYNYWLTNFSCIYFFKHSVFQYPLPPFNFVHGMSQRIRLRSLVCCDWLTLHTENSYAFCATKQQYNMTLYNLQLWLHCFWIHIFSALHSNRCKQGQTNIIDKLYI